MKESNDLEQQFMAVYEKTGNAIFRYCLVHISDKDRAMELTQESFTRLWSELRNGKKILNCRAFLYRVAHNLVLDDYKKKKNISLDALKEKGFEPSAAPDPGELDLDNAKKDLLTALGKLEDHCRQLITLRHLEQVSIKEMSEILNEKENVLSVRLHRCMEKFKEYAKEHVRSFEITNNL